MGTSLKHHGVKGQKWGVIRDDSGKASTAKGKVEGATHVAAPSYARGKVHKAAKKEMESGLKKLNSDPRFAGKNLNDRKNSALRKTYDNEVLSMGSNVYQRSAQAGAERDARKARIKKRIITGVKLTLVAGVVAGAYMLTHADDEEEITWSLDLTRDENGFIVSFKPSDEELAHHGVKGQKWGIRKRSTRGGTPASKRKPVTDDKKEEHDAHAPKKKSVKDLSDAELKDSISRLQMEKQFKQLTAPEIQAKSKSVVKDILAESGKSVAKQVITNIASSYLQQAIGVKLNAKLPAAYHPKK
jgi:hypothetical protein